MAARVPQTPVRVNVYDLTDANAYTAGACLLYACAVMWLCGSQLFAQSSGSDSTTAASRLAGTSTRSPAEEACSPRHRSRPLVRARIYTYCVWIYVDTARVSVGATFRETIEMGMFIGTASEAHRLAMSLSTEFDGNSYNLFTK